MKHLLFLLPIVFFTSFTDPTLPKPVVDYPKGYFQSPVAHALSLSGSFGELRANHFHSGIDISRGINMSNEPIYAAAEGYVSRISVKAGGYGQALYIAHPNGYTTVYAHLEKFVPVIDSFLKNKQYQSESFEQELVLQPNEIPIQRGQQVAFMGNRGHSFGQHLHFEVRDSKTDRAINPLLFGFTVADNTPPTMSALKVYFLDENKEIIDSKTLQVIRKPDGYHILGDTVFTPSVANAGVAFGIKTYDKHDGKSGDNGVFTLEMKQNDSLMYRFKAETFGFDETRYINAHLDYTAQMSGQGFYHRTFILPGNQLSMYESVVNNGIIQINSDAQKVTLMSADAAGNSTNLVFYVAPKNFPLTQKPKVYNYLLPYNEPSIIQTDGAKFFFPKGSFYNNGYLSFAQTTEGGNSSNFSTNYHLDAKLMPLHYMMTINIKPENLPDSLRDKAFIAYCPRGDGHAYNCGGAWTEDGWLMAKNNRFGNYCIMIDKTPPRITPSNFKPDMTKATKLSFKIKDNIESAGTAAGLKYRGTVDGAWILMEFDDKNDLLYHQFDGRIATGEHTFRLEVTDNRGNVAVYENKFKR